MFHVARFHGPDSAQSESSRTFWVAIFCGEMVAVKLFRERLSEKVLATIPEGIVDGFELKVLQRDARMFASANGKQQM